MTTLFAGTINATDDEWQVLSTATEVTFTEGSTYTIQIIRQAYIREGNTADGGFLINDNRPFQYTAGSDDLYIKIPMDSVSVVIND